ncbi:hypothetical protein HD841_003836 [Sphingomonas melonis]|uniref:Uncharacterized protein n=1 Tax=Sphingomonas melonis TaxID=152682 RepID=A0A7Y9K3E2_9SPHN|nr:hypothetical protein [Sphingomonas melonis]
MTPAASARTICFLRQSCPTVAGMTIWRAERTQH